MRQKIFTLLLIAFTVQLHAQLQVQALRCENLEDPLGIDVQKPRLSWQILSQQRSVLQTSYQVLVASSLEKLNNNQGDIWNSANVNSSQSILVDYRGKALVSRMACYWKVKVITNKGASYWSKPAIWTMGLLHKEDWKAKWIGYDHASPWDSITTFSRLSARYLRKEFPSSKKIRRATAYVSGLGLYEFYLNGSKVDDRVMAPLPTDYR